MLPKIDYIRAKSMDDALRHLSSGGARIHAGGTDLLGCLHDGIFASGTIVSLQDVEELHGIERTTGSGLRIGAMTTISEVATNIHVLSHYKGLAEAASEVAIPQLRNQGTLGGNLCQRPRCWYYRGDFDCAKKGGDRCFAFAGENAYHAIFGGGPCFIVHPSDTAPMLMALGALVRISGPNGNRVVAIEDFFTLPKSDVTKETILEKGEMVTEVLLPAADTGLRSSYLKVRERGGWDFALAGVALAVRLAGERIVESRVVFSGVAPVPWRSKATEEALKGQLINAETAARAAAVAVEGAKPLAQNVYKVPLLEGAIEEILLGLT
jgi:xanthine dehydrogenase YagS FAD-binding subunit